LVIMAATLVAIGCGKAPEAKAPPPREVEVLKLEPAEVRETGEYLGSLLSRQSVSVLPQVAGYVRKIHVKPGDRVAAGAPLLDIDARQEAAALDSAAAQRRAAGASLELARQTRSRNEALYQEGLISAQELEQARAQAESAEASLRSAEAQVAQRSVQLQYFTVRAPFAGTVGDVLVRLGDFVNTSTGLTSIAQADVLEVSIAVPADRARTVKAGMPVELLDRAGEVLVATEVYFVAPQANPRTQLVDVKAVFRNEAGLRPSEMLRVRLVFGNRQALQIPALAVVRQSGQAFAWVVQEKEGQAFVERRPITLGPLGRSAYVVESGLGEGERIAVSAIQSLRDRAPVAIKQHASVEK
jgi:RND family efflux transporter MFP subunit